MDTLEKQTDHSLQTESLLLTDEEKKGSCVPICESPLSPHYIVSSTERAFTPSLFKICDLGDELW